MFKFNTLWNRPSSNPLIVDEFTTYGPGTRVTVDTMCYGQQVGTIVKIVESPFYGEAGTQKAYVVGNGWTDYIAIDDLFLFEDYVGECPDCDRKLKTEEFCNECGHCYGCCECAPSWLDDPEFPDYEEVDTGEDYDYDNAKDERAISRIREE